MSAETIGSINYYRVRCGVIWKQEVVKTFPPVQVRILPAHLIN